jgi:aryl-alcohol dehydrogenase-like predicted oxidoreductase
VTDLRVKQITSLREWVLHRAELELQGRVPGPAPRGGWRGPGRNHRLADAQPGAGPADQTRGVLAALGVHDDGGRGRRPRRYSGWQRRGGLAERERVAAGRCAEHAAVPAAELLIRDALYPYPEGLVIATKGGFVRGGREPTAIDAVGNPNYLRQCVYMSARRLGIDRIDLYYLHSGWAKDASFEEQVGTLAELRKEGLIGHIGLSNVTVGQLRAAQQVTEIAAVTAYFNVAARHEAALLDATVGTGTVFCPWQPVSLTQPGAATDTSGPQTIRRVLDPIAARHGATIPQVTLAWLLARSPAILPVPATTSINHLQENLDAQDLDLIPEDIKSIDSLVPEN